MLAQDLPPGGMFLASWGHMMVVKEGDFMVGVVASGKCTALSGQLSRTVTKHWRLNGQRMQKRQLLLRHMTCKTD